MFIKSEKNRKWMAAGIILLIACMAAVFMPWNVFAAKKSSKSAKTITVYAGGKQLKSRGYWVKDSRNSKKRVAMIPLGETAKNLGLKVKKHGKEVKVTGAPMYMTFEAGKDGYSFTTSDKNLCGATGMIKYGAGSAVRSGKTYVPAKVFRGLYMEDSAVKISGNTVTVKSVK